MAFLPIANLKDPLPQFVTGAQTAGFQIVKTDVWNAHTKVPLPQFAPNNLTTSWPLGHTVTPVKPLPGTTVGNLTVGYPT